jgi:hypothetical protein
MIEDNRTFSATGLSCLKHGLPIVSLLLLNLAIQAQNEDVFTIKKIKVTLVPELKNLQVKEPVTIQVKGLHGATIDSVDITNAEVIVQDSTLQLLPTNGKEGQLKLFIKAGKGQLKQVYSRSFKIVRASRPNTAGTMRRNKG